MRIPHCALYQVPHALAFLSVAFLLDCSNSFMLVLGLGIDQAVVQVVFVEPLCLFPQICFAYACTLKSVLKFVQCESFEVLDMLPRSKLQNVATSCISCFTFFQTNQLEICVDAVVPQLDGWAEVAFWAQYLPDFLFCVHSYFFHLLIKLYNHSAEPAGRGISAVTCHPVHSVQPLHNAREFKLVLYYLVVSCDQRLLRCDQSPADLLANLVSEFAK